MTASVRALAAALILVLGFAALPAFAQNVTADPKAIAAILREQDFSATIKVDQNGDPLIEAEFKQGTPFDINFYGCEKTVNCTSI